MKKRTRFLRLPLLQCMLMIVVTATILVATTVLCMYFVVENVGIFSKGSHCKDCVCNSPGDLKTIASVAAACCTCYIVILHTILAFGTFKDWMVMRRAVELAPGEGQVARHSFKCKLKQNILEVQTCRGVFNSFGGLLVAPLYI